MPLLVCHGTGDTRVSHEFSQRAFEQASEHRALRFETFEGASHTFRPSEMYWERLFSSIREWIDPTRTYFEKTKKQI